MPLLFRSLSHGEIPFGFFNIESDMVLLNNYFFFASDMAVSVVAMAGEEQGVRIKQEWSVYVLNELKIGNLTGAISGVDLRGFIGEVYGHFPFPHEPDAFKQNPDGYKTRGLIEGIVKHYASVSKITVTTDAAAEWIRIGEYDFSKGEFQALLNYLWVGGYPRWRDNERPSYITEMKEKTEQSKNPLFLNLSFD